MFAKLTTAFALFAVAAQVAVAAPPACLLAAVNTQDEPSDMKAVCGTGASAVKKYISSNCGDNADAANDAFEEQCKDAGVTVSTSSSASKSGSASHSATGYGSSSASATKSSSESSESASASATGTLTSSPSGTLAPYPIGTGASSGFSTATNGTGYAAPTGSGASGSGSVPPSPTESGITSSTGGASRLGMDVVGLAAVGIFGAMLAL
ncbi:hypothetical protein PRZ48_012100 [Zasmidium cellare]|uniref:Uncharacterized protein n=1 Tax=Zasmidium cellare TaxID=395010 RepID=A0ABR0E4G8_ZASCE|nr:hypothetical protein PRZ48_012100 [Zasmidium cellare]